MSRKLDTMKNQISALRYSDSKSVYVRKLIQIVARSIKVFANNKYPN